MTPINPAELIPEGTSLADIAKRTLVLSPVYDRPEVLTEDLLARLEQLGARVRVSRGISDIALHRNLMCATAYETLTDEPEAFDTVFWLDGDMDATPTHALSLCHLANTLGTAVCGIACSRIDDTRIVVKKLDGDNINIYGHELLPAYAGLACMAIRIDKFLDTLDAMDWFTLENREIPAFCQSRIVKVRSEDGLTEENIFRTEDMFASQMLWEHGNGIHVAPVVFGHLTQASLRPSPNAKFLNEKQP